MGIPRLAIICALLNLAGGLLFGYIIGFVPIYTTFNSFNTNCEKLTGKEACETVQHANCIWASRNGTAHMSDPNATMECLYLNFRTAPCSDAHGDEARCNAIDGCTFDYSANECQHNPDWSPIQTGAFAGAMIIGGMIGSIPASKIISALGSKRTVILTTTMSVVATICLHIARAYDEYGLLIFARILMGSGCGIMCAVCSLYVGEMTPAEYAGPVGVLFQVAVTFGIALASAMGLILQPHDFNVDMQMEMRFQVFIGVQLVVAVLLYPVACYLEPRPCEVDASEESRKLVTDNLGKGGVNRNTGASIAPERDIPPHDLIAPFIAAVALCAGAQLTGINAIMNYAPNITKAANLPPLLGNFVVMLWNFVTTLVSIPLSSRFTPRTLFINGLAFATIACFLTGIAVFPGVIKDDDARHGLAGFGVFLFIAAFEIGMGTTFWIHVQAIFPGKWRGPGCSFIMVFQFSLNIVINFCFPIWVVGFSGGPSKNQDKGMGAVFFLFGSFGFFSLAALLKTLYPATVDEEF
jgi:sugar porter (SP) family MFS transporter